MAGGARGVRDMVNLVFRFIFCEVGLGGCGLMAGLKFKHFSSTWESPCEAPHVAQRTPPWLCLVMGHFINMAKPGRQETERWMCRTSA